MASQSGGADRDKDERGTSPNQPWGSRAILNFGANKTGSSFIYPFDHDENGDEFLDEFFNQPEKKRRLTLDQVQFLEKCFIADNKLEPDRKIRIARELGLQPRQITVWFQNRRARWKARQLETEYEALHKSYERLKSEYDSLFNDHEKLKAEVLHLKRNGEPDLSVQGTKVDSITAMVYDLSEEHASKLSNMSSRNESKGSSDMIYEENLLYAAGGMPYALEVNHPNLGDGLVSPDYLDFPIEDPACSY